MNRQGGFTDLFLFIIISFILILALGIFVYIGNTVTVKMHETVDTMEYRGNANLTQVMNDTIDKVPQAYNVLKWGSFLIMFFMILGIFYGSYQVTTKPIFFIPYLIIVGVALLLSMIISNVYQDLLNDSLLSETLQEFVISNFMMSYLPIIVLITGIAGGIIMYSSYAVNRQEYLLG